MKQTKVLFFIILHFSFLKAKAQSFFGFGISANSDKILNISKDTLSPYGFSGAQYNQDINVTISPQLNYRKIINRRFSFQSGLSYDRVVKDLNFSFYDDFFMYEALETLKIRLSYLNIPIRINYQLTRNDDNNLTTGLGINTNTLVSQSDNYQEIIPWELILPERPYSRFSASVQLSLFYEKLIAKNSLMNIQFEVKSYCTPFIRKDNTFGMFKNFEPSRILTYGLGVHYYIKQ